MYRKKVRSYAYASMISMLEIRMEGRRADIIINTLQYPNTHTHTHTQMHIHTKPTQDVCIVADGVTIHDKAVGRPTEVMECKGYLKIAIIVMQEWPKEA
jgi:hypothetical protein